MTANPFPDGGPVEVHHPLTGEQEAGPRDAWPWLPGTVLHQCGPDEWRVRVLEEDGTFPVCFRAA